uniref:Glycosyltransferase n=1 Tax=viral metagenome TaxID=1070528 RepID=A0A6C0ESK6_9ZZZZ
MTVINGIEIDNIDYKVNEIKHAIKNNDPIEEKLNVILVISNPCLYARRYVLLKEFVKRIEEEEENVVLYIVEMIYPNQKFIVTEKNKRHLQVKCDVPLWHKENMINMGVKMLPSLYKAFAWIDADIEFESSTWALDTLKILNGCKDVVQLFSHCVDMDKDESTMRVFNSFGYNFCKKKKYVGKGTDYWHPGYAWAMNRKAYEKVGIADKAILGSGDNIMALSFINKCNNIVNNKFSMAYNEYMLSYQEKAKHLRLGYVPGVIRHYFHGTKLNRKYNERWLLLVKYQYNPNIDVYYSKGLLKTTETFSNMFKEEIMEYFRQRKEDE